MDVLQLLDQLSLLFEKWGYTIILFGTLIETTPFGWMVPGGAILVIAGYLSNGNPNLLLIPIIIFGTFGTWTAFLAAYFLGKKTGMKIVKKLKQEKNAKFAKKLLKENGGIILTTSMMANLTRFWISYIAGVENYNFLKFNLYAAAASLSWVSLMVLIGYFAGYEKGNLRHIVSNLGILSWLLLIFAVVIIVKTIKHEWEHFKKDTLHTANENHK